MEIGNGYLDLVLIFSLISAYLTLGAKALNIIQIQIISEKYLPELKSIHAKELHQWDKNNHKYPNLNYPAPIVNYKKEKLKKSLAYFSNFSFFSLYPI